MKINSKAIHQAVVNNVMYKHWKAVWTDNNDGEEKVLVIVHLPSGQWKNDFEIKIHRGGTDLSIYEVSPKLFRNTKFVQKQSSIDKSHVKAQQFQPVIN